MEAETEARMHAKAREAAFYALVAGACGWCTDEGGERRAAVFEYSRLDALMVARSGYLGGYARAHANGKDLKKLKDVADFLASPNAARSAGVAVKADVTESKLGKAEFFARRAAGVDKLMGDGAFSVRHAAEIEWMKREAERETGFGRSDANPLRRKQFQKFYNKLRQRDFR
jgi:hypothetical protein